MSSVISRSASMAGCSTSSQTITYRGLMFTGVPNLLQVFGYFRSSYTLRVDLIGDFCVDC